MCRFGLFSRALRQRTVKGGVPAIDGQKRRRAGGGKGLAWLSNVGGSRPTANALYAFGVVADFKRSECLNGPAHLRPQFTQV